MQRLNPPALLPPPGGRFAHVTIPKAGDRSAFIAGQVALDRAGKIIGATVPEQARQSFLNIRAILEELKVTPQHIAQLTMYVVGYQPDMLMQIDQAGDDAFEGDWPIAATTLLGVEALGHPDFLFEVTAVITVPSIE